jgi:hypothetical protein
MKPFFTPEQIADTACPGTSVLPQASDGLCHSAHSGITGGLETPSSDKERELHIKDCRQHMEDAYERFQKFGLSTDRDEAFQFMFMMNEAIRGRTAEQTAAMEVRLGLTPEPYFSNKGAEDRLWLFEKQAA